MKKLSSNNQGFSVVEAVIGLLVLAALAFGGWWVYDRNKSESVSVPDGWVEYQNSEQGVSFIYPQSWNIEDVSTKYPEFWTLADDALDDIIFSLDITSDNFVGTTELDNSLIDAGALFRIVHEDSDGDEKIDLILNGEPDEQGTTTWLTEQGIISELSDELNISGNRGVSYGTDLYGPEGQAQFITNIDAENGHYAIFYEDVPYLDEGPRTDIKSAEYYDEYMMIVNSFKSGQ